MKVLVIGGGGREHALAWKLAASPHVAKVLVAPGNYGTSLEAGVENRPVAADDIAGLVHLARTEGVHMTVVGPEGPLVAGVVDAFAAAGLPCLGPTRAAAELEGSKAFCKDFLMRHGIPTAAYRVFSDAAPACDYIAAQGAPIVVKAAGLAAGKGVVVARTVAEAQAAVNAMFAGAFGSAGSEVVVEDFLAGEEASFMVLADGCNALPLASSQDHKARDDGDLGPNTGGMGAYSPAPVITGALHDRIMSTVIQPALAGMAAEGRPYRGLLYAGLMISPAGKPMVLEFNCRFGDPEAQPILMRLKSDLFELCTATLEGRLDRAAIVWDERVALGVVLAAAGYPANPRQGDVIQGPVTGDNQNVRVFHSGTAARDGDVVTAGGRVLCVCALADTVAAARQRAYERVASISFPGMQFRRDIGARAVSARAATKRID